MPKTSSEARGRAGSAFAVMALALTLFAPPTVAEDPDFTVERRTDYENGPSIEFRSTQRATADYSGRASSGSSGASSSGSGSVDGGVPAVSGAPGGSSRGGPVTRGPLEMVCTGEREGIPGSAARPGDAGAVSSHCQYVPGTPTPTPETGDEPADDSSGGEGEAPSAETIVRTALSRVAVSGAGLSWQPRKKSYTNAGVPTIVYAATPSQAKPSPSQQ